MPNYEDVKFMYGTPRGTYKGYDRQPNESWDQFIVRKMGEERREEVYPVSTFKSFVLFDQVDVIKDCGPKSTTSVD